MPVLIGFLVLVALVLVIVVLSFLRIWLRAAFSGAHVTFAQLIGMKLRRVRASVIVDSRIMAVKAGLKVSVNELEAHYMAGGRVMRTSSGIILNVIQALIMAAKAGIVLTFERSCAIDLAGRDVVDAVQTSVKPKVIDAPDPTKGRPTIDAVAKDGIQLRAKARVTVRTNLDQLVGGAIEETIIARVGEGMVTTIGSSETHKMVLENPDAISKTILAKGLDSGTAFEILSIDIADIDVGENIGAQLQTAQAKADMEIAQAKAEERKAMAQAREQEMKAQVVEMRARVVEAEAEVPKAISYAFREGQLGVMDYYNLKNIQSDTNMRRSIAGDQPEGTEPTPRD
ncbi:flotillin-like protein FloA [Candidatus Hydrogenedentota bacterium]